MSERIIRALDGSIKIISFLGSTLAKRKGYEKNILNAEEAGVEIVDDQIWEKAHSQGRITGHESKHGIVYAPFEVNRKYQQHGIEEHLRQIYEQKLPDVEFELETVTECHSGTRRLSRIQYKVTAIRSGVRTLVFQVALIVGNELKNPTVRAEANGQLDAEPFLIPTRALNKQREALKELSDSRERLFNEYKLYSNEHQTQLDLANKSFAGFVTNAVFNSKKPEMVIWNNAYAKLLAAKRHIENGEVYKAQAELILARLWYLYALHQYLTWKDGIEVSGKKMQIAIGVTAAILIIAAVGATIATEVAATEALRNEQSIEQMTTKAQEAISEFVRVRVAEGGGEILVRIAEAERLGEPILEAEQIAEPLKRLSVPRPY